MMHIEITSIDGTFILEVSIISNEETQSDSRVRAK